MLSRLNPFGYDLFLSYPHGQNSEYVENLETRLAARRFACFLDRTEAPAGERLDPTLRRAIRASKALVLVAGEGVADSRWVKEEISLALDLRRRIITVVLPDVSADAVFLEAPFDRLRDRIWHPESETAHARLQPSDDVLNAIERSFRLAKRRTVRQCLVAGVWIVLAVAAMVTAAAAQREHRAREIATQREYTAAIGAAQNAVTQKDYGRAVYWHSTAPAGSRGWEWDHLANRLDGSLWTGTPAGIGALGLAFGSGARIAVGTFDGNMHLWNRSTAVEHVMQVGTDRGGPAVAAAFDRTESRIVVADGAGQLSVWDVETRQRVAFREVSLPDVALMAGSMTSLDDSHAPFLNRVAFCPDDDTVALCGPRMPLLLWNWRTNRVEMPLGKTPTTMASSPAFSVEHHRLATSNVATREVVVVDLDDPPGSRTRRGAGVFLALGSPPTAIAFGRTGDELITGHADGRIGIWRLGTRGPSLRTTFPAHEHDIQCLACRAGSTLVSSSREVIRVWDLAENPLEPTATLTGHENWVSELALSADSETLAAVAVDGTTKVWSLRADDLAGFDERAYAEIEVASGGRSLPFAFAPDGGRIAVASDALDHEVVIVDLPTRQRVQTLRTGGPVWSLRWLPSSSAIVVGTTDGLVEVWDLDTDERTHLFRGDDAVRAIATVEDRFVFSDRNAIVLCRLSGGDATKKLFHHAAAVSALAFSPDDELLASADLAGELVLWDTSTLEKAAMFEKPADTPILGGINSLAITSDSEWLASGWTHGTIILQSLKGNAVVRLDGHARPVLGLSFSPDGTRLASASADTNVYLFDIHSGRVVLVLRHPEPVVAVRFSPDGRTLASTCADGRLRLWSTR